MVHELPAASPAGECVEHAPGRDGLKPAERTAVDTAGADEGDVPGALDAHTIDAEAGGDGGRAGAGGEQLRSGRWGAGGADHPHEVISNPRAEGRAVATRDGAVEAIQRGAEGLARGRLRAGDARDGAQREEGEPACQTGGPCHDEEG